MNLKHLLRRIWRKIVGQPPIAVKGTLWSPLIEQQGREWEQARQDTSAPRVLLATSLGGFDHGATLESALAVALTLRGAKVDILLCDSFLPACQLTKLPGLPPKQFLASRTMPRCDSCVAQGKNVFGPLGLHIHWYSQLVTLAERAEARQIAATTPAEEINETYRPEGLAIGEHALAGALRYYARGDLQGEPEADGVRRRYLEAAHLAVFALRRLLKQEKYDVACFHHGLYVPQGLVVEVCKENRTRVVTWNPAYRKHCFVFSHADTYHHTMIAEPTSDWENAPWGPEQEKETMDYLKSRWQGSQDWIWFHERPEEDASRIAKEVGIDFSKPCIGLLSNVMWDAVLHYKSNAFAGMLDWVVQTIHYFARRPELQLVIRVHPAEVRGFVPSRQMLAREIQRAFPKLPANVFVIGPESQVSTYALAERCDSVIIYNTKTGIELAAQGIPVIVAGEAWIRNKGFSLDASTPDEYFRILDRLPLGQRMTPAQVTRARRYAHHFFLRRMIPLPFVVNKPGPVFEIELEKLTDLRPGKFSGLDVICDGILNGTRFIHQERGKSSSRAA
jgi:hypothetical protein